MKSLVIAHLLLIFSLGAFAQVPAPELKETDDPELLHKAAMDALQKMADQWAEIAQKPGATHTKNVYQRLSDSFATLKLYREELYLAEKTDQPFHYEKLHIHINRQRMLIEEAELLYGKNAPQLPPEVKPKPLPAPKAAPTPAPPKSYRTESGFEVQLQLED